MSFFDWLDLTIIIALYGAVFWFGGTKWRWVANVSLLALHLVALRYFLHVFDNPVPALALLHSGLALVLLAWSESNYGRMTGACFFGMVALDGLAISGIISPEIRLGLHVNYWNGISLLQHIQAATLAIAFYRYRGTAWVKV